jgi:hypothetical protein
MKLYNKDDTVIGVSDSFIYSTETYVIWKNGASLLDKQFYKSKKLIKFKNNTLKKKLYTLHRYVDLTFAPEEWLINNGFKLYEKIN